MIIPASVELVKRDTWGESCLGESWLRNCWSADYWLSEISLDEYCLSGCWLNDTRESILVKTIPAQKILVERP